MFGTRGVATVVSLVAMTATPVVGQDLSKYRDFTLGSPLAAVATTSGTRADEARTLHTRPASIQELEWRPLHGRLLEGERDAVREVVFDFYDDQLYRIVVKYDLDRTEGMTDADFIDALAGQYGPPLPRRSKPAAKDASWIAEDTDTTPVGFWESPEEAVTLLRGKYSAEVRLVIVSKRLGMSAVSATREAIRLDTAERPLREKGDAARTATDAQTTKAIARGTNKAAFRP